MDNFLNWLGSSDRFMPHGHCYLWEPSTLWLNVGSDALISGSYFAIPVVLSYFVRARKSEIAYSWVPLMFGAFIFLCGTTHVMEIWTVWYPDYRIAGVVKLITGLISFITLLAIIWIMPQAMLLRTPRQLTAEVEARTAEIAAVNARLRAEIAARTAAEQQLRAADRRKDEFLATLAHELRNPLAPIRNSVRLLSAPAAEEQQRQRAQEVISRQVHRMALMLDDLLDLSRITRGRFELKREPVALRSVVGAAVETASPSIEAKSQTLDIRLPEQQITLNVDPLRLSQALSNLLLNAAKFSDTGRNIVLSVEVNSSAVSMSVTDHGIGFEADAVPRMFEMFSQVKSAHSKSEGLGIGLALVEGLIGLHGGTTEAFSEGIGRGSRFTIHLPTDTCNVQAPAQPEAASNDPTQLARTCKVLVADDNRDAAETLALVLEISGHQVAVAHTGEEALRVAAATRPDVMILDIGMPDMSGYEVARQIRQHTVGAKVLLLAMTGWGQAEDIARSKEAGFDHHLTKPVDPERIERLLQSFVSG